MARACNHLAAQVFAITGPSSGSTEQLVSLCRHPVQAWRLFIGDRRPRGAWLTQGLELLQMVGEKWPEITTILTSGFQLESVGESLPFELLFKPWSVVELTAAISRALARNPGLTQQGVDQHPA